MNNNTMQSKSFYSHHSAWGGYFSFIFGKLGYGGGFVQNDINPPSKDIYIGYRIGNRKQKLFPFFSKIEFLAGEEFYRNKQPVYNPKFCKKNTEVFKEDRIKRIMKWSTESWIAEYISVNVITPFGNIPDPVKLNKESARFYFCPSIFMQLEFDNSNNQEEMIGFFSLQGMKRSLSAYSDGKLSGAADGGFYGFAAKSDKDIKEILGWNVVLKLNGSGGLAVKIPPGEKKKITIALASFNDRNITCGIKSRFYYTQLFSDLDDVLNYALSNFSKYHKLALEKDEELEKSGLNEHKKFMIAHFTRSYIANTEFLLSDKKEPLFIVNEGEYRMINTLDLIVDQVYWEMFFTPWAVKNELEIYLKYYSYTDFVKYKNNKTKKGEICFCHDEGLADIFYPNAHSSYEISGLTGCFSFMTHEQILNYLITAAIYGINNKDFLWMKKFLKIFINLFNSLVIRDENNDGIMDKDSSKCGNGSEITTYDSLDASLGQARNNLYLAVKTWAGYICLENVFKILKNKDLMYKAGERSKLCASTIVSKYNDRLGYIPSVFEKNNQSKIIPAIEGLIYPYIIDDKDAISFDGRFKEFIKVLKTHLENILLRGSCINSKSGGWQLSSTSDNTWMSKIIINQFIAEKILKIQTDSWEKWDKIHSSWQQKGCSMFAATDQINSNNGKDLGSRLYPRLVTSLLWMKY